MQTNLYPFDKGISGSFYESFLSRAVTRSQIIYITVVVAVIAFLASMPFVKVSLSVQGSGIIRPITERTEVKSLATELIDSVYVHEGQYIEKGQPLLKLRVDNLASRMQFLQFQESETQSYITDLKILTGKLTGTPVFKSPLYQQEYYYYSRQNDELQNKIEKSRREYERNKKLFNNGVIAAKEFEDIQFQYQTTQNELKININNNISKWQADLIKYQVTLKEVQSSLEQVKREKDFYTVRAPVSGNLEQFTGIYPGNTLRAGETVAVISPDSTLISEIYVNPKDIGYLDREKKVKIQVDAFNYNEWGVLQGDIKNISSDFIMVNNTPMFRVRCTMDKNYLSLQNGIKGYMKKGMTVRARFKIAERSLFQLIYQDADSWLNPVQYSNNNK